MTTNERIAKLRVVLQEISETGFGWDGDCGVTSIADRAIFADEQAEAAGLTDADIRKIATDAYRSGDLSWLGFDIDPITGTYGIPVLSVCHYQLARAIERHIAGMAGGRKGGVQ